MGVLILSCFPLGFLFVHFNKFNMYEVMLVVNIYTESSKLKRGKFSLFPQRQPLLSA